MCARSWSRGLEPSDLTIGQAAGLLAKGDITSVELTRAVLDRIASVEEHTNAFVTVTETLAMEQAEAADRRIKSDEARPLTGIPMALKDNMSTSGIVTTCSSRMLQDFVPVYDATVARKLYAEGAVLVGKGNLDEFAMGSSTENSFFFPTHNPWDLDRSPGGSSGGPAAAVAAGEAMYSLGSDTGGSIRQPASFCGVVGMKPTYGLVSRYGLIAFASSLDQIGPITRNVADAAIVLNAIVGYDPRDSTSIDYKPPDYTKALDGDIRGLRVGVPREYFVDGMDPGVEATICEAIRILKDKGATVEETLLPHTPYALAVYYIIAPSEASANLARYDGVKYGHFAKDADSMWDALEKTRQEGFGPEVQRRIMLGTHALSAGYYDAYYLKAQRVRTLIRQEFDEAFKKFDVLVTPTSPSVAFRLGEKIEDPMTMYLNDIFTQPANIAGLPAISVQGGMVDGLPVGLQFMANHMQEKILLRAAHAYEQSTEWHFLRPNL